MHESRGTRTRPAFRPLGWAFATWGSVLYRWAGVLYVVQVRRLLQADAHAARPAEGTST